MWEYVTPPLWVTYTPSKVYANPTQRVCITGEKLKWQNETKGEIFLHYSEGAEKGYKVMYHSWKYHVWCVTGHCNIMKQTCIYTLCNWWNHSLMKLNCEMSKTHNKFTYSILQAYQWWWGKILYFKDSHISSHLKWNWEDFMKGALYRQIVPCVCCTLTLNYSISIDLSFNHSHGGDDNSVPQYELPAALTANPIIGSRCWFLR